MLADSFGSGANQFDIEFVSIGNPNNPDDTTGNPELVGRVEYGYRMGKFEISRNMINKANSEGGLGITLIPSDSYTDGARDEMPAAGVTWFEAAMFVNWLNTSQGHQAAYNFDGDGDFQLWSSADAWQIGGENLYRHRDAFYFLPNVDEWYKAAFYDASSNTYFDYPTGSDTAPAAVASGTAVDTAVIGQPPFQGPADIMLAGGLSSYGTMGQGGNVWEWEENEDDLTNDLSSTGRSMRGGDWANVARIVSSSIHSSISAGQFSSFIGFRVASIPEPSTMLLGALATARLFVWRRR